MSSKHRVLALLGAGLTAVALSATAIGTASAADVRRIELTDDCDPATFNAAIGPGTCRGDGDTTFAEFLKQLSPTRVPEDWAFDPARATVKANQTVLARNVGGETHTFTCVTQFGAGVVDVLNTLGGFTTPAVPCTNETFGTSVIPSGGHRSVNLSTAQRSADGAFRFQCLIHPWMRTTLRVGNN